MQPWKFLLVLGTTVGWLLFSAEWIFPPRIWADSVDKDLSEKKKDLKEIRKELSRTKEKEKQIQGKETSVLGTLQNLENDLYRREKELIQIERKLAQTKERLRHNRDQVVGITERMEKTREELSQRFVALYKMKRTSPEALLLSSDSTLDFLKMERFLNAVIHYDSNLITTYGQQVTLKEQYQKGLIQDRIQRERDLAEMEEKKREIEKVRKSKRALLESIRNQKMVTQKVIQELEERVKELQTLINKLEREKSVFAYGRSSSDAVKGKLLSPVQGKVISSFKEKGQNGIEIQAPMGSEIRAVLPGKVLYSDWFKGFGKMVIIDHGDHLFTVSGYASDLLKKEGDLVSQGEAIALVGSAGSLKGACLYFEIRHRGKPENPLYWLSVPESSKAERK